MRKMNYEEWQRDVQKGCEYRIDGVQGANWCKEDPGGVTAYCDMHCCPRLKDK